MRITTRPATDTDRPTLESFMADLQEFERALHPESRPVSIFCRKTAVSQASAARARRAPESIAWMRPNPGSTSNRIASAPPAINP